MARGGDPPADRPLTPAVHQPTPNPPDDAVRGHRLPTRLLPLLIAMTSIGPLSLNILVPAVPALAVTLAADPNLVQLTISLYLLGLAFSQLALGPLSDRFGRRPVVLAGLAITAISSAAAVAVSGIVGLIVARTLQSLGASTGLVIGRAIVRDLVDRDRAASMLGLVTAAVVVAPMFGPLIGGILDTAFGWQSIFVFTAVVSGLVLLWAALALPETRAQRTEGTGHGHFTSDLRALLSDRRFYGYMLAATFTSAPFFAFLGGGPHMVVTQMGRTSAEYGVWWVITSIGYMAGNYAASRLSLRFGVDALIKWGLWSQVFVSIALAILAEIYFHLGPAIPFLLLLVLFVGNGIALPNAIAGAVSVRPQAAGTASGIAGFVQMASGAVITQIAGWALIGASTALPMTLIIVFVSLLGILVLHLLRRKD
jgi:MFS transporter, DHA1 family, multidrug resistance protein